MKKDSIPYLPFDNPFQFNYIFSQMDLSRAIIKWFQYPLLWLLPTYVQCSDGYAWFYKRWQGMIFIIKSEKLIDTN